MSPRARTDRDGLALIELTFLNFDFSFSFPSRTPRAQDQEAREGPQPGRDAGGEAPAHRLLRRPAGQAQEGVRGEPLPQRGAQEDAGLRPGAQRDADQDLVPEQKGQAEEVLWGEGRPGQDASGTRAVQPRHGAGGRRRVPQFVIFPLFFFAKEKGML